MLEPISEARERGELRTSRWDEIGRYFDLLRFSSPFCSLRYFKRGFKKELIDLFHRDFLTTNIFGRDGKKLGGNWAGNPPSSSNSPVLMNIYICRSIDDGLPFYECSLSPVYSIRRWSSQGQECVVNWFMRYIKLEWKTGMSGFSRTAPKN